MVSLAVPQAQIEYPLEIVNRLRRLNQIFSGFNIVSLGNTDKR